VAWGSKTLKKMNITFCVNGGGSWNEKGALLK